MAKPMNKPSEHARLRSDMSSLGQKLEAAGNPERAVQEKRYLKSPFKSFGVSLPATDKIAREFRKANKDAARNYIFALAEKLWDSDYHDEKRLGIRVLQFYPEYIDYAAMPMLEKMLMESTGWDLVDDIAIHLVGTVLEKDKKAYAYLKEWSMSDNFWMRRASLISQIVLFRNGRGNRDLFFKFAEPMVAEKEFFIRKAIGWCIREIAKADPGPAFEFLMKIKDRASGLTLREGAKRLPEKAREMILRGKP
jgi:3-methyladenine DNA glycosylase AlkD